MAYEYYNSYQASTPLSLSQGYRHNLQQLINNEFENASDYYVIERYNRLTSAWENVEVRITSPYHIKQMYTIKDDYRTLIFKDVNKMIYMGDMFRFNDYIWICMDLGHLESPTNACMVQRCNITLKFIPNNEVVISALSSTPLEIYGISSKYLLTSPTSDKMIIMPDNQMILKLSNDSNVKLIKYTPNGGTRFLIGNPYQCWNCISIDLLQDIRPDINGNNLNGTINIKLQLSQVNNTTDNLKIGIAKQSCY